MILRIMMWKLILNIHAEHIIKIIHIQYDFANYDVETCTEYSCMYY